MNISLHFEEFSVLHVYTRLCIYGNNDESDLHLHMNTVTLLITANLHCVRSPSFHTSFPHFFHLHLFPPLLLLLLCLLFYYSFLYSL
jgi:hypothetical protein